MEKGILIISILIFRQIIFSQNVGINNPDPKAALDVTGSFRVQSPVLSSSSAPTPAQTYSMNNAPELVIIPSTDSVFRIYDPGSTGSYFNNMQGNIFISNSLGCKLNFNPVDFGLGQGDTLWISNVEYPDCRTNFLYRFSNTTIVPNEIFLNGNITLIFRSNGDSNNGVGFDLKVSRLYKTPMSTAPLQAVGTAMHFDENTGAIRAGLMGGGSIGKYSIALGERNTASGAFGATALGSYTTATGNNGATALGSGTVASGIDGATAVGYSAVASGNEGAISIGYYTNASGDYGATALGYFATAKGYGGSTALGFNTTASGDFGATAVGNHTIARSYSSLATGRYNDTIAGSNRENWITTDPLFTLGNGSNEDTRSNAVTVYKNGNTDLNGYVRLGKVTDSAPRIKMKELTMLTSDSKDGYGPGVIHGLDPSKIISVSVILPVGGLLIPPAYDDNTQLKYNYYLDATIFNIKNQASGCAAGDHICSKTARVVITYKE